MAGDGIAPHRLDQPLLDPVVAAIPLGVGLDVVVEVALVDEVPAVSTVAPTVSPSSVRTTAEKPCAVSSRTSDSFEEHAVDDAEVVAVLQADDLLAANR